MTRRPSRSALVLTAAIGLTLASCGRLGGGDAVTEHASTRPPAGQATPVPAGGQPPTWSHTGEDGPDRWGSLAEDWAVCSSGREQSPIDLGRGRRFTSAAPAVQPAVTAPAQADTEPSAEAGAPAAAVPTAPQWLGAPAEREIDLRYHPSAYTLVDTGHGYSIELHDGGALVVDGVPFRLERIDFRTPSEHTLGGARYPAEYQLVHRSETGEYAMVAVLAQRGRTTAALAGPLGELPAPGARAEGPGEIDPADLVPQNRTMARYNGSLTEPPCTEQVRWHVMLAPGQLSPLQLVQLSARYPDNGRPVQPDHSRTVVVEVEREPVNA